MTVAVVTRYATQEPTCCAVCRRRAVALGYSPQQRKPMIWLCSETMCHSLARKVYDMPADKLDAYELVAARRGGEEGGAYLDEIGKSDLAQLDAPQWDEFLRRVVVGYEHELRRRILAHEAPF